MSSTGPSSALFLSLQAIDRSTIEISEADRG